MKFHKKIECFIKAILYPNSNIIIGYKDVQDSQNAINVTSIISDNSDYYARYNKDIIFIWKTFVN